MPRTQTVEPVQKTQELAPLPEPVEAPKLVNFFLPKKSLMEVVKHEINGVEKPCVQIMIQGKKNYIPVNEPVQVLPEVAQVAGDYLASLKQ